MHKRQACDQITSFDGLIISVIWNKILNFCVLFGKNGVSNIGPLRPLRISKKLICMEVSDQYLVDLLRPRFPPLLYVPRIPKELEHQK